MAHQTMLAFGYPDSLVAESAHWTVQLRPQQVTAGCLVLICKAEAISLGAIAPEAGAELPALVAAIEQTLRAAFGAEKFNYLALMMVDPHVHFHVIPRYGAAVQVAGAAIPDPGWPGAPDLKAAADLTTAQMAALQAEIRAHWPD
ncbi:HIT family protein [Marinibaculum pumilum]|uniref:HIT family protein n=1 Tax=Marinibaculum pumilum TaxID=1766165 RepID=A0ABV7KTI0_9PROT